MSLMSKELVLFDCEANSKEDAVKSMAEAMDKAGFLANKEQYINDVFKREETATTAIGFSFATPHAKSEGVDKPCLGFMKFKNPIQWDKDSEPVKMAFQIAVPITGGEQHLEILAAIFKNLIKDDFRSKIAKADSEQEICDIIAAI